MLRYVALCTVFWIVMHPDDPRQCCMIKAKTTDAFEVCTSNSAENHSPCLTSAVEWLAVARAEFSGMPM